MNAHTGTCGLSCWKGADLVVRVSLRAVVMYSDIRFSISATRIHARP